MRGKKERNQKDHRRCAEGSCQGYCKSGTVEGKTREPKQRKPRREIARRRKGKGPVGRNHTKGSGEKYASGLGGWIEKGTISSAEKDQILGQRYFHRNKSHNGREEGVT